MLAGSYTLGTISKYQNGTPKVVRKAFNIDEVWNPVCCHGNKTVEFVLKKLESHSAIASCDSYASFVLSNLPRASITR